MKPFDMSCIGMAAPCVIAELSTDFILVEKFNSFKSKVQEVLQKDTSEPPPATTPPRSILI
jgi:hypothetical protein